MNLAFADPPFGIGFKAYDDRLKGDSFVVWCCRWMQLLHDKLRPDGTFWLAMGDEHVSELDVSAKRIGFHKRSHVVWHYQFGVACSKNFSRSHTHLLYYTKHRTRYTFNQNDSAVRVPSARMLKYNDKRQNPNGKLPDNTWVVHPDELQRQFGEDQDTWLASRLCGTFKERRERGSKLSGSVVVPQMPQVVMQRIIRATSNPGDLVIDPFSGTGATADAALTLGRRFWGCDLLPKCVKMTQAVIDSIPIGKS